MPMNQLTMILPSIRISLCSNSMIWTRLSFWRNLKMTFCKFPTNQGRNGARHKCSVQPNAAHYLQTPQMTELSKKRIRWAEPSLSVLWRSCWSCLSVVSVNRVTLEGTFRKECVPHTHTHTHQQHTSMRTHRAVQRVSKCLDTTNKIFM